MSTHLSDVLAAIKRVTGHAPRKSGDGYSAHCPAHDDSRPSLTITAGTNGQATLINCHRGCTYAAIVAALGLDDKPTKQIAAIYSYRDRDGKELRQKVRYQPKDFRIRHGDASGAWVWRAGSAPPVLYRLPEVLAGIQSSAAVWIVEGEKDTDKLATLGLCTTTSIEGAAAPGQRSKWRREYTEQLSGAARVVLPPDNDDPGRAHMRAVAQALKGKVRDIRMVELPELPPKGDVSDWLAAGHTVEELVALAEQAAAPELPDTAEAEESETSRAGKIEVIPGRLPEMTDEAEAVLVKHDAIYQRGGYLARLVTTRAQTVRGITRPGGNVGILPLDTEYLG